MVNSLRTGGITAFIHHSSKTDAAKDLCVHEDVHKHMEIMKDLGL